MKFSKPKGIYQLENGYWAYRYSVKINGKTYSSKKTVDEFGNKLKTSNAAAKARESAICKLRENCHNENTIVNKTFEEVYNEYCEKGRIGKAYSTIKKQDALWKNHIKARFGKKSIGNVSVSEINDYLSELYYIHNYSYRYVEGFLKMFYLILGQAYSRNYLEMDKYSKLCMNKATKISMPKLKIDEDLDIVIFDKEQLNQLDNYFKGSNMETAYMLGKHCGLRVNECFGLKWDKIDFAKGTITIDRQMQYQDGLIKLVPVKTRNAKRTIYMSDKLKAFLQRKYNEAETFEKEFSEVRKQNRKIIKDIDGMPLPSTKLVNSLPNGKIQTVNSVKYHTKQIKRLLNIDFKYHYWRHTYGTLMAELNTPEHLLCSQLGHCNIQVTQRYYLALSKTGINILKYNLDKL